MAKMNKKWVVLCSTAIAAVYSATYFSTEAQASSAQAAVTSSPTVSVQSTNHYAKKHITTNPNQSGSHNSTGSNNATSASNNGSSQSGQSSTQSNNNSQSSSQSSSSSQSKSQQTATQSKYKDGTYTGTGMNRRGMMQVVVTIKNDKITNVQFGNFEMHYPEGYVSNLPNEVLQNQSAQVQNVSGATYSTMAFEQAVQDALGQAQNS